jgi:hypothetical protein
MADPIPEADWKIFRELHELALDRFCARVLDEVLKTIAGGDDKTNHERFLAVSEIVERRNHDMADAFDDPRPAHAIDQLVCMQRHNLLTSKEMSGFSQKTREIVQFFIDDSRR